MPEPTTKYEQDRQQIVAVSQDCRQAVTDTIKRHQDMLVSNEQMMRALPGFTVLAAAFNTFINISEKIALKMVDTLEARGE